MKELIELIKLNAEAGTLLEKMSLFDEFDDMTCLSCLHYEVKRCEKLPCVDWSIEYKEGFVCNEFKKENK